MTNPVFVSTQWLADNLDQPDVVVLDASWYLPAQQRDAVAEYAAGHIPGAVRFDLDAVSDHTSSLPHMHARRVCQSGWRLGHYAAIAGGDL